MLHDEWTCTTENCIECRALEGMTAPQYARVEYSIARNDYYDVRASYRIGYATKEELATAALALDTAHSALIATYA